MFIKKFNRSLAKLLNIGGIHSWYTKRKLRSLLKDAIGAEVPENFRSDPESFVYVATSCLPYHVSGYTTRTQEILKALSKVVPHLYVLTRTGYPWDRRDSLSVPEMIPTDDRLGLCSNVVDGITYDHIPYPKNNRITANYADEASRVFERYFMTNHISCVHAASNHVNALPALIAARRLGIPFQYEMRGLWELTRISRDPSFAKSNNFKLGLDLEAFVASNADTVFVISQALGEYIHKNWGISKNRIKLLPNCAEINSDSDPKPATENFSGIFASSKPECDRKYSSKISPDSENGDHTTPIDFSPNSIEVTLSEVQLSEEPSSEVQSSGVPLSKVQLSEVALSTEIPTTTSTSGVPSAFSSVTQQLLIGYAGSLIVYEGIQILLRAISILVHSMKISNVHLCIIGDGEYRSTLEKLSSDLGINDYVSFLGRLSPAEARAKQSEFSLVCIPRENFEVCRIVPPIKLAEAMAKGKCVLVPDLPVFNQELSLEGDRNKSGCLFFKAGDPEDLARTLKKCVDHSEVLSCLGEIARGYVARHRSWQQYVPYIYPGYVQEVK